MNSADLSHIAPEILEEAACGRLDAERSAAVKAHCAVCPRCSAAYDEELHIAHGTRSWARAALKARLASRVGSSQRTPVPWTRILAAAAVLLIIGGTGIVYQWLHVPADHAIPTVVGAGSTDSLSAPGTSADRQELADARTMKAAPAVAPQNEAIRNGMSVTPAKREREDVARAPATAPAAAEEVPAPVAEADRTPASREMGTASERIVWGDIIATGDMKDKAGAAPQVSIGEQSMEARGAQMQGIRKAITHASLRYTVNQEVVTGAYRSDAGDHPRQIPARVSRSGDTVHIVLLLASLVPDDAIRAATVLTFPPDSLQVHLPGMVVGIKMPPGLLP